jgi:hypothetical protein
VQVTRQGRYIFRLTVYNEIMSDTEQEKEVAVIQEPAELPVQQSPSDTTNWDNKVSTDPSGEMYIRTLPEQ